jgi:hypothetical protein
MNKRKKPAKESDPLRNSTVTATFKKIAEEHLREISSGADIAEQRILEFLGQAAFTNLKALIPEHRAAIALEAFQRLIGGAPVAEVNAWLSIKVRDQRLVLETAAKADSGVKAERRRGGIASTVARWTPWQPWREWICKDADVSIPAKANRELKNSIIDVIRFRSGAKMSEPSSNARVPNNLPVPHGQNRKPPSEDAIRRNLFGGRAK